MGETEEVSLDSAEAIDEMGKEDLLPESLPKEEWVQLELWNQSKLDQL